MNRTEPRVAIETTSEGRVALSIPHGHRVRILSPKHTRNLAGLLLEAADAADALKAARLSQPTQRNKPNARPAPEGLVRVSLGTMYVDAEPAEALRLADKLVDVVEELEAGTLTTTAPDGPVATAFAQLAEAAHEDTGP